jgi:hypothetical protein
MKNMQDIGFKDYCVTSDGAIYSLKSKRFLNLQYNDNGYVVVTLRINYKTKTLRVHRLVAMMYLRDTYFDGAHVNHIDGDKSNNAVQNLEWVTREENMRHAYDNNLIISKPKTLSDHDLHLICQSLESGSRVVDVARMFSLEREIVDRIYRGTLFKHISYEYDFSKVPKQSRISVDKVIDICRLLEKHCELRHISEECDVHISTVKAIKQRRVHVHISNSFSWL